MKRRGRGYESRRGLRSRYGDIDLVIRRTTQVGDLLYNGHTIRVAVGGSHIELNDLALDLVQFHFHGPSEHRVWGQQYPLEIHFVHSSEDGAHLPTSCTR